MHYLVDVSVMSYGGLKFVSYYEVIIEDDMVCFNNSKGMPKKGLTLLEWSRSMAQSSNASDSFQ